MSLQTTMTGDDWLSERDRSRTKRTEAARRKAGQACAAKLEAAAKALNEYLSACRECNDGSGDERTYAADSRMILIGNIMEYAAFLDSKYNRR